MAFQYQNLGTGYAHCHWYALLAFSIDQPKKYVIFKEIMKRMKEMDYSIVYSDIPKTAREGGKKGERPILEQNTS